MKKREGFEGQKSIILPDFVVKEIRKTQWGRQLHITDIGYYPKARFHFRKRIEGSEQNILIYCVDGKGWISVEGKRFEVSKNQYFLIPKGISHQYGSNDNDPWSIYWVHFSGDLASMFYDISGKTNSIAPSEISRIEERIMLYNEMFINLDMGYSFENLEYANVCLLHFLASFKYVSQFRLIRKAKEEDRIEKAIIYMKENLKGKITLHDLAERAGLSPSHFTLLFRKKTGRSPMDYLIYLRIQKACQLLDSTDMRIKEIAQKTGYDDPYYFSRIFTKLMGKSPGKYRKEPKG